MQYFVTNVTGNVFSDKTSTFLISVFFRHDIYIDDISVFHTWHLQLYHQCFFLNMTSVFFRHDIYIYDSIVFLEMTSTMKTSLYFRHEIYIDDISVFETWHLQLYHQCFFKTWHQYFSDMASTFITSVSAYAKSRPSAKMSASGKI